MSECDAFKFMIIHCNTKFNLAYTADLAAPWPLWSNYVIEFLSPHDGRTKEGLTVDLNNRQILAWIYYKKTEN